MGAVFDLTFTAICKISLSKMCIVLSESWRVNEHIIMLENANSFTFRGLYILKHFALILWHGLLTKGLGHSARVLSKDKQRHCDKPEGIIIQLSKLTAWEKDCLGGLWGLVYWLFYNLVINLSVI